MAIVAAAPVQILPTDAIGDATVDGWQVTWSPLTTTNTTGSTVQYPGYADKSVAFVITGTAATVILEGSNDNVNFFTLTNPLGNAVSTTTSALFAITEAVIYVRPRLSSGGDGTTSISATMFFRKTQQNMK